LTGHYTDSRRLITRFNLEQVTIGLAADGVNESVAVYFPAALHFRKDEIASPVSPNSLDPVASLTNAELAQPVVARISCGRKRKGCAG
jgi:hypothetical protein